MTIMTPVTAQRWRLTTLLATVAKDANCARYPDPDLGDWHRQDGEPAQSWYIRRQGLIAFCETCPVLAACREVALRTEPDTGDFDMVRAGLTRAELMAARRDERDRLNAAALLDRDPERAELAAARRIVAETAMSRRASAEAHDRVTVASATIRRLTAARRKRAGWGVA